MRNLHGWAPNDLGVILSWQSKIGGPSEGVSFRRIKRAAADFPSNFKAVHHFSE